MAAEKLSGIEATMADRARADELARLALRQDPTAVIAASTLALNSQVRGDTAGARRLFGYAETLSRRNLQTELWEIEDSVRRNDIAGALKHYDIALRTSRNAPDLLYPVLASAITDAPIRAALIRVFSGDPSWGGTFLDYVSSHGPDPRATATLFLGLRRAGIHIPESPSATLISSLVAHGWVDEAWTYYASGHPGADRRRSRDPNFTENPALPVPFDWVTLNDSGVTSSFQRGSRGGAVEFSAPASIGGRVLQQMQALPPGEYRLQGRSSKVEQPDGSQPYWGLYCADGRELGRVTVPNSAQANGEFAGRFTVPPECPMQMLALVARPTDSVSGLSGQIDAVRLLPLPD